MLKLRCPKTGLTIEYDIISLSGRFIMDSDLRTMLPAPLRGFEIIREPVVGVILEPPCGWAKLTLENFEEMMGYSFRISKDDSMRGVSREVAFLEFLESKGVDRKTRLVEGLTLKNFAEKIGHRFKRTKEDMDRGLTKERAFQEWCKRNGYT